MKASPVNPKTEDGRNVDAESGSLSGEGAQQVVRRAPEKEYPTSTRLFESVPSIDTRHETTYYGLPVIKEPVWKLPIPLYFYAGGVAGGAMALAAALELRDGAHHTKLVRRAKWMALVGVGVGTVFLIEDLGRPSRFHHMLRVFRPTSPMNVGAWILSAFGTLAGAAALLPSGTRLGRRATVGAGAFGLGLSTYTAVLLSNTAVPLWQGAHRRLPYLFGASSASSAASLLELLDWQEHDARVVRRYAVAAKATELVTSTLVERELGRQPGVAAPLSQGLSGALWKVAKGCTLASLGLSIASPRSRPIRRTAGLLGTVGALALRIGIFQAGVKSSRDPHATFRSQRAGFGAAEVTGRPAVAG